MLLCGDVFDHREFLRDSISSAAGLTPILCSEDREHLFSVCRRLKVSLLVARQAFIEQLTSAELVQLTNYGKNCYLLAILANDDLDSSASAAQMLRVGCRGVLPHRFSPKLLRRAVLAVRKGELWAPHVVVSELLTDLLREATLKTGNGLTPQEARILQLASKGYKNSAIAEELFISQETVRWHKRRLNRKLRGSDRLPQATAIAPGQEIAVG